MFWQDLLRPGEQSKYINISRLLVDLPFYFLPFSKWSPPSPRFSHSSRWRWITVWLMRSGREFPLTGDTRSSDLTAAPPKPSWTARERGRLTLVNIDLLLPPALPRLLLSALWCEIRRHIRTHTKTNQTSVFVVLAMVFPGDSNISGCLTSCWMCFMVFVCHDCQCPHEYLPRLIHLCSFSDWSPARGPYGTTCLPCLVGIPISAGFQGFPLCILTSLFPSHTWRDSTRINKLLSVRPHTGSEEVSRRIQTCA